jgi:hypothetical protein
MCTAAPSTPPGGIVPGQPRGLGCLLLASLAALIWLGLAASHCAWVSLPIWLSSPGGALLVTEDPFATRQ